MRRGTPVAALSAFVPIIEINKALVFVSHLIGQWTQCSTFHPVRRILRPDSFGAWIRLLPEF